MRVRFSGEVLENEEHWRHIVNIAEQCARHDHQLDVSNIDDWEEMDEWLEHPSNRTVYIYIQGLVEQLARGEQPEEAHKLEIEVQEQTPDPRGAVLSPTDADAYVRHPAQVIVENETSDGPFFELLCHVFGRRRLIDAIRRNYLTFYNAGGYGNLWPIFQVRCSTSPRGPYKLLVLKDGDSQYKDHRGDETERVETSFTDGGAVDYLKVLVGRDVENYMTRACLLTLPPSPTLDERVEAFCRLSVEQRLYYDMERGLRPGEDVQRDQLYHGVNPILGPGFTSKVKGRNKEPGPIRRELERYKHNQRHPDKPEPVNYLLADIAAELKREVIDELGDILDRIEALL